MAETPQNTTAGTVNDKDAAIRALTAAGFTLIPLNGKIPAMKGWLETIPGRYGVKELAGRNYGVLLKPGDLVVDVDPRNFVENDRPLPRLVADFRAPLDSFTVLTGGGGVHSYLRKPADVLVVNSLKKYPGIEFKSSGRFVVGPGSVHPDTKKVYTILSGAPSALQGCPQELLKAITRPPTSDFDVDRAHPLKTYMDDAGTVARFTSYLENNAPTSGSFVVACHGRDLGLSPEATWERMVQIWNPRRTAPRTPEELKSRVIHAYLYAKGALGSASPAADFEPVAPAPAPAKEEDVHWDTTKGGGLVKGLFNLLSFMKIPTSGLRGVVGFNEFTGQVEITAPAPWHNGFKPIGKMVTDTDLKMLKAHLSIRHGFEMPVATIEEAVTITAQHNKFHPVREYLTSLKWDKTPRLNTWLHDFCGAAASAYVEACARKVICAAVTRVLRPGCKFDHVLVLEGEQGIGKSGICSILGGEWSGDFSVDPSNKDTIQLLQGQWIVELAELEVTRRAESDALKAFLTRKTDKARLAYGRLVAEFPRQSIFIATKNPGPDGTYLKDDTGNRRWWPVLCRPPGGLVDFKGLKAARDQIFAEALALVTEKDRGEKLYMETEELKAAAADVAEERHAEEAWTERIATWISQKEWADGDEFLTARDIYVDGLSGIDNRLDRRVELRIASAMRSLGWKPGYKRIGRTVRGYRPIGWEKKTSKYAALGDLI